jgi:hypothetical protein
MLLPFGENVEQSPVRLEIGATSLSLSGLWQALYEIPMGGPLPRIGIVGFRAGTVEVGNKLEVVDRPEIPLIPGDRVLVYTIGILPEPVGAAPIEEGYFPFADICL